MIRTRDLVLFVLVLFFLGTAITSTLIQSDPTVSTDAVEFTAYTAQSDEPLASAPQDSRNRAQTIERLKKQLATSEQTITPAASVEAPEVEEQQEDKTKGIQRCLYPDDALSMVPRWPLSDVSIESKEGARVVVLRTEEIIPVAATASTSSSTQPRVITTISPLLQLPLFPIKSPEASCVPSEVIGVTNGGVLMFNGDVNSYRKIPENALIGYARDGFPIYGVYQGEVDECGGYDHQSGYRYTVSTQRDYIVGCYAGNPSSFSL